MNNTQRNRIFQNNPRRKWLWVVVLVLQASGLGLVLAAIPVQLLSVSRHVVPSSLQVLQDDRDLFIVTLILFGLLACLNILAIIGIWRLSRWVHRYIVVKLVVAALLIFSMLLIPDYLLLIAYVPLFCSLVFMTWAYRQMMMLKPAMQQK